MEDLIGEGDVGGREALREGRVEAEEREDEEREEGEDDEGLRVQEGASVAALGERGSGEATDGADA